MTARLPRRLFVTYSIPVVIEIPDDFPLTAKEVQATVDWLANDHRDGRLPFSTETMMRAALDAARSHLSAAIFQHYCRRIDRAFGSSNAHIAARDRLVARLSAKTRIDGVPEETISVTSAIYEAMVECPGCLQMTPTRWRECPCSPGVPLPGRESKTSTRS